MAVDIFLKVDKVRKGESQDGSTKVKLCTFCDWGIEKRDDSYRLGGGGGKAIYDLTIVNTWIRHTRNTNKFCSHRPTHR